MTIEFHGVAQTELDDAFAYYDAEDARLGADFKEEVQQGLRRIVSFPQAWPKISRRVAQISPQSISIRPDLSATR